MQKMILIGEFRIGAKGAIHQRDFAEALGVERLSTWPKTGDVAVVVGRLLGGRTPALLHRAQKKGAEIKLASDVLTPEIAAKLVEILSARPKLEPYEKAALEALAAPSKDVNAPPLADVSPAPKKGRSRRA